MVVERGANVTSVEARPARRGEQRRPAALARVLGVQRDLGQHVPGHQHRQRRAGAGLGGDAAPGAGDGAAGRLVAGARRGAADAAPPCARRWSTACSSSASTSRCSTGARRRSRRGCRRCMYATLPMTSAFLTRALGMERLTLPKLAGAITAFAGVVVLFSPSFSGQISPAGLLAIFAAATLSAVGNVVLKRGPRQKPIGANAVGCAIGAVISAGASFAMREPHPLPTDRRDPRTAALSDDRRIDGRLRAHVLARQPLDGHARQLHLGAGAGDRDGARQPAPPRTDHPRPTWRAPRWCWPAC